MNFVKWQIATPEDVNLTVVCIIVGVVIFHHGMQKVFGWFGGPGLQESYRLIRERESLGSSVG